VLKTGTVKAVVKRNVGQNVSVVSFKGLIVVISVVIAAPSVVVENGLAVVVSKDFFFSISLASIS